MEETQPSSPMKWVVGIVLSVVFFMLICGAVPVVGVLAAIAIPNFVAMQLKAKRAEAPANLDGLKTAMLAYDAAFDGFVSCGREGDGDWLLGKEPHDFTEDPAAGCIREKLGWYPDGPVRGVYWTKDLGGGDFEVHVRIDVDGDGWPAEYVATNYQNATMVTPGDVY